MSGRRNPPTASTPDPGPTAGAGGPASTPLARAGWLLGMILLGLWVLMWGDAFLDGRLAIGKRFWIPELDRFSADFFVHIGQAGRIWASGGNPYDMEAHAPVIIPYPPLVPRSFVWASLMGVRESIAVWTVALMVLVLVAAHRSWRTRRELGLNEVPRPLLLAAAAFCTPVLFLMERGQCDALVLPLLAAGAWALVPRSRRWDVAAGALFVMATYVKYYPGLTLLALLAMRRWWSVGTFVVLGGLIALVDFRWLMGSRDAIQVMFAMFSVDAKTAIHPCEHSLSSCWRPLWTTFGLPQVAGLSGRVMAPALLLPMVVAVCRRVDRSARSGALLWPLMLWVVAAATFIPQAANDYNLFYLPLAALAVWDRRDPTAVQLLMGYLLIWWQPFALPIDGALLLAFKVGGLAAVGVSLWCRASEPIPSPEASASRSAAIAGRPGLRLDGSAVAGATAGHVDSPQARAGA